MNGTLSAEAVALIIAALISPLVGWLNRLFAKNKWPTEVNAALAYGLTILGAVLSSVTLLSHQRWQYYVITIGTAFAMHVVSHTGYKNLGATVTPSDSASEGPPETVPPRTRRRRSTKGDAGGVAIGLLLGIAVFVVVVVLLGWFVSHWLWFLLLLVVLIVLTRNRSTV